MKTINNVVGLAEISISELKYINNTVARTILTKFLEYKDVQYVTVVK